MLEFDGEYPAVHLKVKILTIFGKKMQKKAVKLSMEKPILLNFVNLSPTFCPELWVGQKAFTRYFF